VAALVAAGAGRRRTGAVARDIAASNAASVERRVHRDHVFWPGRISAAVEVGSPEIRYSVVGTDEKPGRKGQVWCHPDDDASGRVPLNLAAADEDGVIRRPPGDRVAVPNLHLRASVLGMQVTRVGRPEHHAPEYTDLAAELRVEHALTWIAFGLHGHILRDIWHSSNPITDELLDAVAKDRTVFREAASIEIDFSVAAAVNARDSDVGGGRCQGAF
jgi:hypothetical protein